MPYAFVNLKVGASGSATPQILVNGRLPEYAFFEGLAGGRRVAGAPHDRRSATPATSRWSWPARSGPRSGSSPSPAGTRSRSRPAPPAPFASPRRGRTPRTARPIPRYTYFTVTDEVRRLGAAPRPGQRPSRDAPGPHDAARPRREVVHRPVGRRRELGDREHVRLPAPPLERRQRRRAGRPRLRRRPTLDGWDPARVRGATVVVPPNDVVSLTDPLVQLFGLTPPAVGALEVRAAPGEDRLPDRHLRRSTRRRPDGGTFGFQLPTLRAGRGGPPRRAAGHPGHRRHAEPSGRT